MCAHAQKASRDYLLAVCAHLKGKSRSLSCKFTLFCKFQDAGYARRLPVPQSPMRISTASPTEPTSSRLEPTAIDSEEPWRKAGAKRQAEGSHSMKPGFRYAPARSHRISSTRQWPINFHRWVKVNFRRWAKVSCQTQQGDRPNACVLCHRDNPAEWVDSQLKAWKGSTLVDAQNDAAGAGPVTARGSE